MTILQKDNFLFGLALGIVTPLAGFLFYKLIKFRMFSMEEMFHFLKDNPNMITAFISISLIANGIIFTLYINRRCDRTGKGIFIMTVLYAAVAMAFKYW